MTQSYEPIDDDLLAGRVSTLTIADAEKIALDAFGIAASAATLSSERDQNFRLVLATGEQYVLKVSNPAEDPRVTDFQTKAQLHLMQADQSLPVPHLVPTTDGEIVHWYADGSGSRQAVRLLTFLPGVPMFKVERSRGQRIALGHALARFNRALADFSHAASGHELLWDMQHTSKLRGLLTHIAEPDKRRLAESFMDRFDNEVAPRFSALRRQVIHNDLNPYNAMVDPECPDKITAILDFGDMVEAPLINDLAVACTYQLADTGNPLRTAAQCVAAYHAVSPLTSGEFDLLPDLMATRLLLTVAITGWRAKKNPDNSAYILRNAALSWRGLELFARFDRNTLREYLRNACDFKARR